MKTMTAYERMKRMYEHKEADRVPVTDGPWGSTLEKWQKEGLPKDVGHWDYFGLDDIAGIYADNSPRFPAKTLEETEEYTVQFTPWGVTCRNWKHAGSVPEFLDFTVKDPDSWKKVKEMMTPSRDRIDWKWFEENYRKMRSRGAWIFAYLWFGFDVTHAWLIGTERMLVAMAEQPEWISDMFNHYLDVHLKLFQMIWDAGYHFDEIHWPDDMGYKNHTFFSLDMYRNILKPVHKKACDWAHAKGIKTKLHSCGYVEPFIPDLIEIGVDMLNPLEVKAGMDPVALKKKYGDKLGFQGGLNAVLFGEPEKMREEMKKIIPAMKKNGGYIISSDHSVPDSVSLQEFGEFVRLAKELGSY